MTRAAFSAALFLLGLTGVAQQSAAPVPLGARLKVRWQGAVVRLLEGGRTHEVSIKDQFGAAGLSSVKLQSAKAADGFIYLLLDVRGPSKIPGDSHQCGAGMESNLIWLKLDKSWKRVDAKNVLYESCWSTVDPEDPPQWQGDTLKVTVDRVQAGVATTLVATYSYKHPEEGLKVEETPATK
jgi:hypothetical protein